MAQFHMTPEGPKKCSARTPERCHYTHYSTPEGAVAAFELEKEKSRAVDLKKELEHRLRNMGPDNAVQPVHDFNHRGDLGPSMMDKIRDIEERTGKRPEFIPGQVAGVFEGPGGKFSFGAQKGYKIEGSPPRVVPQWTLVTHQMKDGKQLNREIESYPLTSNAEGRELKKAILAKLNESTSRAWPGDPDKAAQERDKAADSLVNAVSSYEMAERGPMSANTVGFSTYSGTNENQIMLRADWAETPLDSSSFRSVLNSPAYRKKMPTINLYIQDSQCKRSKNYWTAERADDGWRVHFTRGDQTESLGVADQETLHNRIYSFSRDEMGSSEARAERSATDTTNFIAEAEYSIIQHEERAEKERERARQERELDLAEELYPDKPRKKKGLLGSLFR